MLSFVFVNGGLGFRVSCVCVKGLTRFQGLLRAKKGLYGLRQELCAVCWFFVGFTIVLQRASRSRVSSTWFLYGLCRAYSALTLFLFCI